MNKEKPSKVLTTDDFENMIEKLMSKISVVKKPPRPSIDSLKKAQDEAILRRELAIERNEKVRKAAENGDLNEQINAVGSDNITPFQMLQLHQNNAPSQPALPPPSNNRKDMMRNILGHNPSTCELERYADISHKLEGKGVSLNERGEIMLSGYPIPNSNLAATLRFFVKGTRGFKGIPIGVNEIGGLLKEAGIASSKFPESIRPYLGGKKGRRRAKPQPQPPSADDSDELGVLTNSFNDLALDSSEPEQQHGEGISMLHKAMDHAENGDHDEALDLLNTARQYCLHNKQLKDVETYLSSLRD